MELFSILVSMVEGFWWLLPFVLIAAFFKSPGVKGWFGEQRVKNLIRRRLDPSVFREFHDVTVPAEDGSTSQIDHVYVSPFGILVIETKNMGHWIFGGRKQRIWTQQIYRTKVPFQNPLHQNYRHIKALQVLLDLPLDVFKSIVVFTGDCTFKTEMPDEVCTCDDLIEYIHSIDTRILATEQIDTVCTKLRGSRLERTFRTRQQHIDGLRRRHGEYR
jgi:hypothetical protein